LSSELPLQVRALSKNSLAAADQVRSRELRSKGDLL
jgi:hypothetical protein